MFLLSELSYSLARDSDYSRNLSWHDRMKVVSYQSRPFLRLVLNLNFTLRHWLDN